MAKKSPINKVADSGSELLAGSSTAEESGRGESRDDEGGALESERLCFKRVRHYDSDRAPVANSMDTHKISRYLMAVKNARARTIFRIVEQEQLDEKNLAWIRDAKTPHLRKVDESELGESSLSRWVGCQSVELEVRGSVPANFKGFSFKNPSARKVVEKEPKKRGRPRIHPQPPEKSASEPRRPRGRPPKVPLAKFEKPITLNERLHSLVDESIAQRLLTEKRNSNGCMGRRTNNSLNVSLETVQQRNVVTPPLQQFKIPKKPSETTQQQQNSSLPPTFKRPKVEPSDFELPANFRDGISVPPSSDLSLPSIGPSSQRNSFQWAADRPCTSSSLTARPPFWTNTGETNRADTLINRQRSSLDNSEAANNRDSSENQTAEQFLMAHKTNGSRDVGKSRKERSMGETDRETDAQQRILHDEEANGEGGDGEGQHLATVRTQLPIFTARTFHYEVDVAAAVVKRFQSAQVADIFDSLPPPIDPRLNRESANGISRPSTMSTVDHLVLRQNMCHQRTAQAFFCGGPLSALAICPRATKRGRELIAVGTFTDETLLRVEKDNSDAFVQLWTTNPKNLNEKARFECLLRVPNAQHICSLNWCPIFDDDFKSFRKSNRTHSSASLTSQKNFGEFTKKSLGLLAVGTYNGRINIYNVFSEIESLVDKALNDSRRDVNSLPPVFESEPLFALRHPLPTAEDNLSNGNNGVKSREEATEGNQPKDEDEQQQKGRDTKFEPSSSLAQDHLSEGSVPLFCLSWSPFSGGRHIGAVSPIGRVFIWDLARIAHCQPTWKLHFDDWNSPPQSICWTEKNKICISFRRRLFRVYGLVPPSEPDQFGSSQPVLECDLNKTCGTKCCSQPLVFPGMISYEAATFSYFGTTQQAPSYIWMAPLPDNESEKDQICATTLSNCHQIQNTWVSVCPLSGLCASVGADGRMACSLNGRMAPNDGGDGEGLMHGRTLLHLIMHDKSLAENENNQQNFCFSHNDCCIHRKLEVRLGDCALLDQENERVCRRRAPEVSPGRRLESLTLCEFSSRSAGLTYSGGESGFLFVVPCTL